MVRKENIKHVSNIFACVSYQTITWKIHIRRGQIKEFTKSQGAPAVATSMGDWGLGSPSESQKMFDYDAFSIT